MTEVTFGFVKPNAYPYREEILSEYILPSGLSVVAKKDPYHFTPRSASRHYAEHRDEPFFHELVEFTKSAPTALYVIKGENAIRKLRQITGPTDPETARELANKIGKETIRSRYYQPGDRILVNSFHSSDSPSATRREIFIHFRRRELPDDVLEMLDREPYI